AAELARVRAKLAKLRRGQRTRSEWVDAVKYAHEATRCSPAARKALSALRRVVPQSHHEEMVLDLKRLVRFLVDSADELPRKGRAKALRRLAGQAFLQFADERRKTVG